MQASNWLFHEGLPGLSIVQATSEVTPRIEGEGVRHNTWTYPFISLVTY